MAFTQNFVVFFKIETFPLDVSLKYDILNIEEQLQELLSIPCRILPLPRLMKPNMLSTAGQFRNLLIILLHISSPQKAKNSPQCSVGCFSLFYLCMDDYSQKQHNKTGAAQQALLFLVYSFGKLCSASNFAACAKKSLSCVSSKSNSALFSLVKCSAANAAA